MVKKQNEKKQSRGEDVYSYLEVATPTGNFMLIANESKILEATWKKFADMKLKYPGLTKDLCHPVLSRSAEQLLEYFAGRRKKFDLPFELRGTDFQKKVWNALCKIPFGETRSYEQIAAQIGNEKACRAVGLANSHNPLAIFYPCHRVIGKSGKLVGFVSGLSAKQHLLKVENPEFAAKRTPADS